MKSVSSCGAEIPACIGRLCGISTGAAPISLCCRLSLEAGGMSSASDLRLSVTSEEAPDFSKEALLLLFSPICLTFLQDAMTYHRREAKRIPVAASGTYLVLAGL